MVRKIVLEVVEQQHSTHPGPRRAKGPNSVSIKKKFSWGVEIKPILMEYFAIEDFNIYFSIIIKHFYL